MKMNIEKIRNIAVLLFLGFAVGSILTDYTVTYQIQKDCHLLKQFRVADAVYLCVPK